MAVQVHLFVQPFSTKALSPKSSSFICNRLNRHLHVVPSRVTGCASASSSSSELELYERLGISTDPDPRLLSQTQLRSAYLKKAKEMHPDVSTDNKSTQFDKIGEAWKILGDSELRRIYDTSGINGLNAVMSIQRRNEQVKNQFSDLPGDQLDMLSETGQLISALLSPSSPTPINDIDNEENELKEKDACPRSIDEAINNLKHHKDESVKYYILWWIYRFKVKHIELENELVNILNDTSQPIRLSRRSALALGNVCNFNVLSVIQALEYSFHTTNDYFLKYRCTEALTSIVYKLSLSTSLDEFKQFPSSLIIKLYNVLKKGSDSIVKRSESSNLGYKSQESLFNIDNIEDEETRKKLYKIFEQRELKEYESKRTTMTPQLGVSRVGQNYNDEPYEWIIKALSSIIIFNFYPINNDNDQLKDEIKIENDDEKITLNDIISVTNGFVNHEIPLVRYAAKKALFELTNVEQYAIDIMSGLEYGVEHHYSQRVLIRDLGDVGYWKSAKSITECPMVENSFKILALKNMLSKLNYDTKTDEVKSILSHIDSLL